MTTFYFTHQWINVIEVATPYQSEIRVTRIMIHFFKFNTLVLSSRRWYRKRTSWRITRIVEEKKTLRVKSIFQTIFAINKRIIETFRLGLQEGNVYLKDGNVLIIFLIKFSQYESTCWFVHVRNGWRQLKITLVV